MRIPPTLLLLLLATLAGLASCKPETSPVQTTSEAGLQRSPSSDSADARGNSLIRFVNAVHDGKAVQATIGGESLFGDIAPGAVTDYREVSTLMPDLAVGIPGQGRPATLPMRDRVFVSGSRHTVFLVSTDMASTQLIVLRDDLQADSGKARIRVLHAAPGAPALRVTIDGRTDVLVPSVAYGADVGFIDLSPARVTLLFTPSGSGSTLLRLPDVDLREGTATTVVITGAGALAAFTFRDTLMGPRPRT